MIDRRPQPGTPAGPGPHELVLLHGQPGSPADWQQVAARLPARLHAVAPDRPGYGSSPLPAGGFAANARAVLDDLDSRGIKRAVLVGHSYGGGVALSAASMAPSRVEAVILLASVGPGCVNGWDRLLAAPGAGQLCALVAWRLTPWIARARLAWLGRRRGGRCVRMSTSTGRSGVMRGRDTVGCGARSWLSNARCCANWASWSAPSDQSRRRCSCSPTPGHPGSHRYRPSARPRPAGRPAAARPRRRSPSAQASPGCRRRRDSGVPGRDGRVSPPLTGALAHLSSRQVTAAPSVSPRDLNSS